MGHSYRLFILHRLVNRLKKKNFRYKNKVLSILNSFWPKAKHRMIIKTLKGFKLIIDPVKDKGIEYKIFRDGIYEKGTLDAFELLIKKNDIVFDLGANIGLTTLHASKIVGHNGKVYSFEAHPETFEILKQNIKLNKRKNITPLNIGVSNINGESKIYENFDVNRGAASMIKKQNNLDFFTVKTKKLDDYVDNNNVEKIDFIKMDIEGMELLALLGMSNILRRYKPILCIELSFDVNSPESIKKIFKILVEDFKYSAFRQEYSKSRGGNLVRIKSVENLPTFDNIYFLQKNNSLLKF